jgi:protein AbiQ
MKIYLYNVDDNYIKYLRKFDDKVSDNKIGKRKHCRKYIGAVIQINDCKYFAPLSSPKPKDYNPDGTIRKDPLFLTRIIVKNDNNEYELKGKILLGNMIPINDIALTKVNPANEKDSNYKTLLIKELDFITKNRKEITRKANIIYNQKIGKYKVSKNNKYLNCVVDFKLLEDKCKNT